MDAFPTATAAAALAENAARTANQTTWSTNELIAMTGIQDAIAAGKFAYSCGLPVSPEFVAALREKGYRTTDCCVDNTGFTVTWKPRQ